MSPTGIATAENTEKRTQQEALLLPVSYTSFGIYVVWRTSFGGPFGGFIPTGEQRCIFVLKHGCRNIAKFWSMRKLSRPMSLEGRLN